MPGLALSLEFWVSPNGHTRSPAMASPFCIAIWWFMFPMWHFRSCGWVQDPRYLHSITRWSFSRKLVPCSCSSAVGSVSQGTDSGTCFPLRCLLCWVFGNYTSLVTPSGGYIQPLCWPPLILSLSLKLLLPQTFWDCSLDYMPWGQLAGCCLPYKTAIFFFSWFWRLCFFSWSQWNTASSVIVIYLIPIAPKV